MLILCAFITDECIQVLTELNEALSENARINVNKPQTQRSGFA